MTITEESSLVLRDSLRGKAKDQTKRSKQKLRKDVFVGDDQHKNSGKWYKKERYVDRDADTYKEVITDPETGEVVHSCEEPLSAHRGHGSAKGDSETDDSSNE